MPGLIPSTLNTLCLCKSVSRASAGRVSVPSCHLYRAITLACPSTASKAASASSHTAPSASITHAPCPCIGGRLSPSLVASSVSSSPPSSLSSPRSLLIVYCSAGDRGAFSLVPFKAQKIRACGVEHTTRDTEVEPAASRRKTLEDKHPVEKSSGTRSEIDPRSIFTYLHTAPDDITSARTSPESCWRAGIF